MNQYAHTNSHYSSVRNYGARGALGTSVSFHQSASTEAT